MTTLLTKEAETERQIRERLEETGQFGAMRAMIVDAALQSLARDQPPAARERLFLPSAALAEAKSGADGAKALSLVHAFLRRLGLQYTASVMALEAGLSSADQAAAAGGSTDDVLAALGSGAAAPAATVVPVPQVGIGLAVSKPTPASSSSSSSSAVASEDGKEEEAAGEEEEPPLPGAEDSTYFISKWRRRSFLRAGQVAGQQVQLEYLTDCSVTVLDPLDSMTVDDCEGGELVVAACEGSLFLRNCRNMTVHVACKQLRTRDCDNIDLHILTTTDPVVEMSHHMTFRPFNLRLPGLRRALQDARLDPAVNRFVHVYDFTVDAPQLPQPHYTVVYPDPTLAMEDRCADRGTPECLSEVEALLAGRLLPAASSESGQNKSYDIKTGSAAWSAPAPAQEEEPAAATDPDEEDSSEGEDEPVEDDFEDEPVEDDFEDGSSSSASASDQDDDANDDSDDDGDGAAAVAVPSSPGSRPPAAPPAVPGVGGLRLGGLDDQDYSSFDESSESADQADKYEVEEDDDDF